MLGSVRLQGFQISRQPHLANMAVYGASPISIPIDRMLEIKHWDGHAGQYDRSVILWSGPLASSSLSGWCPAQRSLCLTRALLNGKTVYLTNDPAKLLPWGLTADCGCGQ